MVESQKTMNELWTGYENGSVTRSEYNTVSEIVENEKASAKKFWIEKMCKWLEKNLFIDDEGVAIGDYGDTVETVIKRFKEEIEEL